MFANLDLIGELSRKVVQSRKHFVRTTLYGTILQEQFLTGHEATVTTEVGSCRWVEVV